MKKKNENSSFENVSNEKQNSLSSGIRISLDVNLPIIKQKFVGIKEAHNYQSSNLPIMKRIFTNLSVRWILRLAIIVLASYIIAEWCAARKFA
jgi:hypothetical protein